MAASIRGDAFGPRPPPLLEYLQQILRGYSDGQILKELLQNAEDAGASEVKFIYDKRHFGTVTLFEPTLAKFQGPAILAFNNAEFADEDWEAIQRPARSDKKENALKVGRFGIGFSSVYHLTDLPSITSGSSIAIIDPSEEYFIDSNNRRTTGSKWNLADVFNKDSCSDQLAPFRNVFPDQETFWQEDNFLHGTLFRFPLRTSPSSLCGSVYSEDETKKLFDSFRQDAPVAMLFLRNVERICLFVRESISDEPTPYLDVSLSSEDMSKFRVRRQEFNSLLESSRLLNNYADNIELLEKLEITTEDPQNFQVLQSWISCQVISNQCSNELKDLAERLHFLPWVGVAIHLTDDCKSEHKSTTKLDGRIFCFLPLPYGETSRSGLPVHVHGYFGVSDDRRSLKWPGGDQIQNDVAHWNKLLVEDVLPCVYLKAVLRAIEVTSETNRGPAMIYNALPDITNDLGNWEKMVERLYGEIFKHPVLYEASSKSWQHVDDVIIDDLEEEDKGVRSVVVKCLRQGGFCVIEDLPQHVLKAVKRFVHNARFVNTQLVLQSVQAQAIDHFEHDERLHLLSFLLSNECSERDLNCLDLLPVGDRQFTQFVTNPTSKDMVYLENSECKAELLPHLTNRFVMPLENQYYILQQQLDLMGRSGTHWKQLICLTPPIVVSLLKETLPVKWRNEYHSKTIMMDEHDEIFTRSWLCKIWEFAFHHLQLNELQGLNLLPISDVDRNPIELITLKHDQAIVSCDTTARKNQPDVITVLSKLSVTVCELPDFVVRHPDLIKYNFVQPFDSAGVMNILTKVDKHLIETLCQIDSDYRGMFCTSVLPFLNFTSMQEEDKSFLKTLQIFQGCSKIGSYTFISLSSNVFLVEEGCENGLPAVNLPKMLLITQQRDVRSFCRAMGVKELKEAEVIKDILTYFQEEKFTPEEKLIVICWIGRSFGKIRHIDGSLNILSNSSFVVNGANQEKRIRDIFDPSDDLVRCLLKENKFFPKETFLHQDGGVWAAILAELGYRSRDNIDQYYLKEVADQISSSRDRDQANALCHFLALKPELLRSNINQNDRLSDYLRNIPFVACLTKRPSDYPSYLPFHGESVEYCLFSPGELVLCSYKNWQLAGSSTLFVEDVGEEIGIRKEPSVEEVGRHLEQLIKFFSITSLHDSPMLHAVYTFLDKLAAHRDISQYLPQKWIWTGEGFTTAGNVCLEDVAVDLRPFHFVIPRDYRNYKELYKSVQVSANVTTADLLRLLGIAKSKMEDGREKDVKRLLDLSCRILMRLLETEDDLKPFVNDLFVPTTGNELLLPEDVSFCDYDWLKHSKLTDDEAIQAYKGIKLISDQFPIKMARRLGVIPLSSRLAMADEIVEGISQTGQYESITTRIRNILSDEGYQSTSIPKEMIQNAEDAGATEVRFLIDFRSNQDAMERLLDDAMKSLQGPALWIYNNSTFSDDDLKNITQLGGGTKRDDALKIGNFGLGFNSVYRLTDVPSFVTRHFVNFFDPHGKFLKSQIRRDGRGIRLDFEKHPEVVMMFRDQFQPYNRIFDCQVLGGKPREYPATLFRLPLRGQEDAQNSEICKDWFSESKLKEFMKSVCDTSTEMLIFTENVKLIEVHILQDEDEFQPNLLFRAEKDILSQLPKLSSSFLQEVYKNIKTKGRDMPPDTIFKMQIKKLWTEKGKDYFEEAQQSGTEEWVKVMSAGTGAALTLCEKNISIAAGLIPCGGIAWKKTLHGEQLKGQIFCCLPLSIPSSELPVHINGSFALSDDRSTLWRETSDSIDSDSSFKGKWNKLLMEDVIVRAYLTFLEQETISMRYNGDETIFSLWPNPNDTPTNGDYGILVSSFYSAITNGFTGDELPAIFWDNDHQQQLSIQQIAILDQTLEKNEKVFHVASDMIQRMREAQLVLKLPFHVRCGLEKAGRNCVFNERHFSFSRFFSDIFLPNLGSNIGEINIILQFALAECSQTVLDLMKSNECIPACPNGNVYKAPSDLYDPNTLQDLFSNEEGYFPYHSLLILLNDRQKGTLRDIGCLKIGLQWNELLERAGTVHDLWRRSKKQALRRFDAIIDNMERKLRQAEDDGRKYKESFKKVSFIPATDRYHQQHLRKANEVYLKAEENIVGAICFILCCDIPERVKAYLDLGDRKPHPATVLENFSNVMDRTRDASHPSDVSNLRQICTSTYRYLLEHLDDSDVVEYLKNKDCIFVDKKFVNARQLSFQNESVPPYMYQVNADLVEFDALLRKANVKENLDVEDFINVLQAVKNDCLNQPLAPELLDDVLSKIVKPLSRKLESCTDDVSHSLKAIFLPDAYGILQPSLHLSFCDVEWLNTEDVLLCHEDISFHQAEILGVLDIRRHLLENNSENIHVFYGETFGQKEELKSRLKRILTAYPCDISILKEIVQNADDAGASEVHFILDKGYYPTQRLLNDKMEPLQGPALLAFNNKPFSEDDIRGIQKLGEGSKGEATDKIGCYGVGFNVVYHLTDCPMFLSAGNTLCVMDPLRYVPGASLDSPGRMFTNVNASLGQICPDFLKPFFSFGEQFDLQKGTLFRFPLRKMVSELSNQEWTPENVQTLLNGFKEEMFDVLLFLRNVERVGIYVKENNSNDLHETFYVEACLSDKDKSARNSFYKDVANHINESVAKSATRSCCWEMPIRNNDGYQERWLVQQRVGLNDEDIPSSISEWLLSGKKEMELLPKAGVAARLHTECLEPVKEQGVRHKLREVEHKAFCFLPLPLSTNLPVHVDGYFALDHETRRNLWHGSVGDPKSDWNKLVIEKLIASVYVQLLLEIKKRMIASVNGNTNQSFVMEKLSHFHTFFPKCHPQSEVENPWNRISKTVYLEITNEKYDVFPVVRPLPASESEEREVFVSWHSCMESSNHEGYFDDLSDQTRAESKENNVSKVLQDLLLKLQFPLLAAPLEVYVYIMNALAGKKGCSSTTETVEKGVLKVSPDYVINFLKEKARFGTLNGLPQDLKETPVKNINQLCIILEYIKNVENCEAKLDGVPLLLTSDDKLRLFSTINKVYISEFQSLLPACKREFVHDYLRDLLSEDYDVLSKFEIVDLAERLNTHLDEEIFCNGDLVPWSYGALDKGKNLPPSDDWLRQVWKYLTVKKARTSPKAFVNYCIQHLGKWALIPVTVGNKLTKIQSFLAPLQMGKNVLQQYTEDDYKRMYQILENLHSPILNLSILTEEEVTSIIPFSKRSKLVSNIPKYLVSHIGKRDEVLHVLERLLNVNYEGFISLENSQCRDILKHFEIGVHELVKANGDSVLKRLPCYETICGNVVPLDRHTYVIDIPALPSEAFEVWLSQSNSIFLQKNRISSELCKALKLEEIDEVELYWRFILPHFDEFGDVIMWYHLKRIMDLVLSKNEKEEQEEKKRVIDVLQLTHLRLIKNENGELQCVTDLFDPRNSVFKVMLSKTCFPVNFPDKSITIQMQWLTFLRLIGLRQLVDASLFLTFAEEVSIDLDVDTREVTRDKILLEHLRDCHELHSDENLLEKLTKVPFITSNSPSENYCELFNPAYVPKVTTNAVLASKCALIWSIEPLCPQWVNQIWHGQHMGCVDRKCMTKCKEKLGINTRPSLCKVLEHTQTLCNTLACSQTVDGVTARTSPKYIIGVMSNILKFLSSKCERMTPRQKEGAPKMERNPCSKKSDCCPNCLLIVKKLESVPFVPVDDGIVLTKAHMVVKNMIAEENCNIFLYLKQIPDELIPYYNTLRCVGATEQPSLSQYASILNIIGTTPDITNNPNLVAAIKQAMAGFLRCLHQKQHDVETMQTLLQMPTLHLMSKSKDEPVTRSNELYYNDVAQFSKRLEKFPHPLLKSISDDEFDTTVNIDELLQLLPEHLKPRFISDFVEERIVTSVQENAIEGCRCQIANKLRNVFKLEKFPAAIQSVVAHEKKTVNNSQTNDKIKKFMCSTFIVTCIPKLETALIFEGREIPGSRFDTPSLFLTNKERREVAGQADVLQEVVIYISHSADHLIRYRHLARQFNNTFKLVKDVGCLDLILQAESDEAISNLLNSEGIGTAGLEEEGFWRTPELGSNIQNDVIAHLNQDIMYIFNKNEYVGLDCGEGSVELLIYAKVVAMNDAGQSTEKPWRINYEVKVGEDEIRTVPAFRLYKFITPDLPDRFAITLYSGPSGDFPEEQDVYAAEKPDEEPNKYKDLDDSKRDITRTLEDVMTMPETDKKKTIRRLLLQWHPDKHSTNKQFAQEVFKHIQRELDRLQNVNTFSRRNFYDDVHQRARQHEEERRQWQKQYRASSSTRNTRGRREQRDYGFYPPPSFHRKKNTLEGRRHFKQARVDFEVANRLDNSIFCCQWKCQLYFFASEKAIKAAQLATGRATSSESGILKAAESLQDELDLTDSVRGLINIVQKDSHYPDSFASPRVPQDEFTPKDVQEALEFSRDILRAVGRHIACDED